MPRFASAALLLLLLSGLLFTLGCPPMDDDGTIKIAVCGPMSGSAAAFGDMIKKAAKLKEKEINAAGGITVDGEQKMVNFIIFDDKGDSTEATNVARKVSSNDAIVAVVGHFNSTCTNSAKDQYNRTGIPMLSPGSTNVAICVGSEYTFRNLYRDDYQGDQIALYLKDVLDIEKAAVFYDNDDYGKGLMNSFKARAEEIGLEITSEQPYLREHTQDFKPLVDDAKASGARAVFVAGLYNEAAMIAKAVREAEWDARIIGGDGVMSPDFLKLAGDASEGALVTTPFLFNTGDDSELAKAFMASFEGEYGKEPDTWAALTYDACGMMLAAIEAVGADREKIKEHLAGITTSEAGYVGVTGVTYFDEEGDCYSKPVYVATVEGGRFVPAEVQMSDVED